jgi:hypothetical protein
VSAASIFIVGVWAKAGEAAKADAMTIAPIAKRRGP